MPPSVIFAGGPRRRCVGVYAQPGVLSVGRAASDPQLSFAGAKLWSLLQERMRSLGRTNRCFE